MCGNHKSLTLLFLFSSTSFGASGFCMCFGFLLVGRSTKICSLADVYLNLSMCECIFVMEGASNLVVLKTETSLHVKKKYNSGQQKNENVHTLGADCHKRQKP